jgi:F0F1-type ATP synthase membrane subunit c/vacuolar-type H+-ATPase subunit K
MTQALITVSQAFNRAGAIPIVQQSGALRVVMGLVVSVVAGIIGSLGFICTGQTENLNPALLGLMQVGLGIMDIIPILGTIGQIVLHNTNESNYNLFQQALTFS